jgi:hypothetical protein
MAALRTGEEAITFSRTPQLIIRSISQWVNALSNIPYCATHQESLRWMNSRAGDLASRGQVEPIDFWLSASMGWQRANQIIDYPSF